MKVVKAFVKTSNKILRFLLIILAVILPAVAMFIYEGLNWMFKTWPQLSMEELVYQLVSPIEGTNTEVIWEFIDYCVPPVIIICVLVVIVMGLVKRKRIMRWGFLLSFMLLSVEIGTSSVKAAWEKLDGDEYLKQAETTSHFIEDNYANPNTTEIIFPEQKRNLVYIYLESMETTYASKDVGGAFDVNYIPELTSLAMEEGSVNFSNSDSVGGLYVTSGSTWTMGAMVSHTSGLPLRMKLRAENIEEDIKIFPNVSTLGDVLNEQGYKQVIMFGSDGEFAGRKQYFEQHGNYDVEDYQYAVENNWIDSDYRVWWGYEDGKLFEFAKKETERLAYGEQPFALTLLTVDTHFEDGYVCTYCQQEHNNRYADVISCSSRQIYDFVQWLKMQPFYQNTTIVLVGDHLTMDSDFCSNLETGYDRTVYNAFINAPIVPANAKNRFATTLDMFPTTLAALGASIDGDRLGLGTNLFSGETTLLERYDMDTIDKEFRKQSIMYDYLAGDAEVDTEVFDMP